LLLFFGEILLVHIGQQIGFVSFMSIAGLFFEHLSSSRDHPAAVVIKQKNRLACRAESSNRAVHTSLNRPRLPAPARPGAFYWLFGVDLSEEAGLALPPKCQKNWPVYLDGIYKEAHAVHGSPRS
jgi:hypothetical protein